LKRRLVDRQRIDAARRFQAARHPLDVISNLADRRFDDVVVADMNERLRVRQGRHDARHDVSRLLGLAVRDALSVACRCAGLGLGLVRYEGEAKRPRAADDVAERRLV
jgi:hypothetical protein